LEKRKKKKVKKYKDCEEANTGAREKAVGGKKKGHCSSQQGKRSLGQHKLIRRTRSGHTSQWSINPNGHASLLGEGGGGEGFRKWLSTLSGKGKNLEIKKKRERTEWDHRSGSKEAGFGKQRSKQKEEGKSRIEESSRGE